MSLKTYATEHAWGSSANLQVVFANLGSVEHGVESSHFIDLHWGHFQDLGSFVHGGQSQEVVVLLLGDEKDWDDSRRLVVIWELSEELLNGGVRSLSELERRFFQVVFCVSVVSESTKWSSCLHLSHCKSANSTASLEKVCQHDRSIVNG